MTFKEKWIQDHPGEEFDFGQTGMCPYDFEYESNPNGSVGCIHHKYSCEDCWNREMSEEPTNDGAFTRLKMTSKKIAEDINEVAEAIAKNMASSIKDSGDRTEFETGAVRDMREGKGRCDLMPLRVVNTLTCEPVFLEIALFQETGNAIHLYRCLDLFSKVFDDGKTKASKTEIDNQRISTMLLEVAKHFEDGAKKYGENNWQKGIPVHCYIDSAVRHYLKWLRGDKDEPHDRAFVWNIMCCIWEVDYHEKITETKK
jgi:hypothetical protein